MLFDALKRLALLRLCVRLKTIGKVGSLHVELALISAVLPGTT